MKTLDENKSLAQEIMDDFCINPESYEYEVMGNLGWLLNEGQGLLPGYFEEMESLFGDNPRDWEYRESFYNESHMAWFYQRYAESWLDEYKVEHRYDVKGEYESRGISYNDFR